VTVERAVSTPALPAVLTSEAGPDGQVWAWFGVQVTAAADLTELVEFRSTPAADNARRILDDQVAYLSRQLVADAAVELRWLWDPAHGELELFLLGRCAGSSVPAASAQAVAAQSRLAGVPGWVQVREITASAELARVLRPFPAALGGMAEVRKRVLVGRPNRPDAGAMYYVAVQPFTASTTPPTAMLTALSSQPAAVMLTVGLQGVSVPPALPALLSTLATQYQRLASPGQWTTGPLLGGQVALTADAFAVEAARVFTDAQLRYRDRAFRMRICLASPAPLDDGFLALVGASVSPGRTASDSAPGDYLQGERTDATFSVERPRTPGEAAVFATNLSGLWHAPWGGHAVWSWPQPPPALLREVTALADAREAAAAFRLPAALHGTVPAFPVAHPALAGAVAVGVTAKQGPALQLGDQLVNGRRRDPIGLALSGLTRHVLIAGSTGSGKTNTLLRLLEQAWVKHRIPFLVVEPVNSDGDDYRWLATRPGMHELLVLTAGEEAVGPLRINPFQVPAGVGIGLHAASLQACFDAAFGLWDPLPAVYTRAMREMYIGAGLFMDDIAPDDDELEASGARWPVLDDFVAALRTVVDAANWVGEVRSNIMAASVLRAESLRDGAAGAALSGARSYPIEALLDRPVVLELGALGDNAREKSLLIALVLTLMTEHYKATRTPGGELAHLTVVEEAHQLLGASEGRANGAAGPQSDPQAKAAAMFATTLAENRKYGEALLIVEQVPGKLVRDVIDNTNTVIMHRLNNDVDRELLAGAMHLSDDQVAYAKQLNAMTAFISQPGWTRPALVQVPNVRREAAQRTGGAVAPLATRTELAARFRAFAAETPQVWAALGPHPECGPCAHRCAFGRRTASVVADSRVTEFRTRIHALQPLPQTQAAAAFRELDDTLAEWSRPVLASAVRAGMCDGDCSAAADATLCMYGHLLRAAYQGGRAHWMTYRSSVLRPDVPQ
jgi:hypothetical protein